MFISNPQLAFLFPGQGSQSLGMLSELAQSSPLVISTYAQASEQLGYDLWKLVQEGPDTLLGQTEYTQPALLAAGVAVFKVWQEQGSECPAFMAGHSLGEYTALVCAGVLDYSDAVSLVALRGRLMQEAIKEGEGSMAAIIGLTEAQIAQICVEAAEEQVLSPANFNAIGQTVLAGETSAITRAIDLAKQMGAKIAKLIPVSVPSHCALMKPAAEKLAEYLANIKMNKPVIPVISNVDVAIHDESDQIRTALIKQLYNPVRWVETIQFLAQQGVQCFVECGPGKVLAGLNKRIIPGLNTISAIEQSKAEFSEPK